MWVVYACLGSLTAAIVAILAKIGIAGVNSNLATALITTAVMLMSWGTVLFTGAYTEFARLSTKNMVFLAASGITTGFSWLFYYKALQLGPVNKVVPIDKFSVVIAMALAAIILKETYTPKAIIGAVLIGVGTVLLAR